MHRLRRKLFPSKKKNLNVSKTSEKDGIYLEPEYDETTSIALHLQSIAEELLTMAKKSSHTIRLSKLHDDLLSIKNQIVTKFHSQENEIQRWKKQCRVDGGESSVSARLNRSATSERSLADSVSSQSIWSPNSSILSSSVPTPTFRRRLAESSVLETNYASVIQEHFLSVYQQLCSKCSSCQCYQIHVRNQMEAEYLLICSYNEQLKNENDLLQRLLADCKYSYEQQYVSFCQYEQYLIDYEQCLQLQHHLIERFQQIIDRLQSNSVEKRRNEEDDHHIYQKIADVDPIENSHRTLGQLYEQCQRHIQRLPNRPQLFSYSREQFHPPGNISGVVEVADLEVSILLVDLLAFKHENHQLRGKNLRLTQENDAYRSKIELYELTNKYFQRDVDRFWSKDGENEHNELIEREKILRLYVYRLYQLLQQTSEELRERDQYYETLLYQLKKRHRILRQTLDRWKSH